MTVTPVVHAADPSVGDCLSATEAWLKLRTDHKLRAARNQLLVCSAPSCPAEVRDECIHHIDEVNAALPTVVFTVKSGGGQELSAVKVSMDGEVVADHLDGTALTLDPGSHTFTFETAGQPPATTTLILHEGEKGRAETVVVGPTPPPAPAEPTSAAPRAPASTGPTPADGGSGLRTVGLVVGGGGIVGLVVGGIFGAMAASSWSTAQNECPSHSGCSPQAINDHNSTTTFATVSTIGFVAGGVLLAGGVTLYLMAPKGASAVGLQVTPSGLSMAGVF
jgi:hypothetical protein